MQFVEKSSECLLKHLEAKEKEQDDLCLRCGACCGAYDDPCEHLRKDKEATFYCKIYSQRLGTRKTVGGELFQCVMIKEIIDTYWKNDHLCIYKKKL